MAFGLKLIRSTGMGEFTGGGLDDYEIDPTDTTPIFNGDPVTIVGGFVTKLAAGANPIFGVFAGCEYDQANRRFVPYWDGVAGRTNIRASIITPDIGRFAVELDASQGNAVRAMIGTRRDLILGAGSTVYGDSGATLGAVNASGPVFVHRLHEVSKGVTSKFGVPSQTMEVEIVARFQDA